MPSATGSQSVADLQRDLHERQFARYRDLQHRLAAERFEHQHGRPPVDLAEIERGLRSGTVATISPERVMPPEEIAHYLTTATGV